MWEPLVDAPAGLGRERSGGRVQRADERRPPAASTGGRLGRRSPVRLRRIDRLAHDEVAVVPLWQLPDHFAYRKDLAGIATGTLTLYQNVEQWKPGFQYPSEK